MGIHLLFFQVSESKYRTVNHETLVDDVIAGLQESGFIPEANSSNYSRTKFACYDVSFYRILNSPPSGLIGLSMDILSRMWDATAICMLRTTVCGKSGGSGGSNNLNEQLFVVPESSLSRVFFRFCVSAAVVLARGNMKSPTRTTALCLECKQLITFFLVRKRYGNLDFFLNRSIVERCVLFVWKAAFRTPSVVNAALHQHKEDSVKPPASNMEPLDPSVPRFF